MFYQIFGDVYRSVRKSTNLSQTTLGAAVGRRRHTIRRWEKGEIVPNREQEKTLFEQLRELELSRGFPQRDELLKAGAADRNDGEN